MRERTILSLVLASILLVFVDTVFTFSSKVRAIIYAVDFMICIILMYDYMQSLWLSEDKHEFLKKYWYEILAFIPAYVFSLLEAPILGSSLRVLRLMRLARALRVGGVLVRSLKLMRHARSVLTRSRLHYIFTVSLLVVILSSFAVLSFEKGVKGSDISNFFDALWWSITTITTVGYGDIVPKSIEGRIIGVFLMIFGISVWTATISLISASLVRYYEEKRNIVDDLRALIKEHSKRLGHMSKEEVEVFCKVVNILKDYHRS